MTQQALPLPWPDDETIMKMIEQWVKEAEEEIIVIGGFDDD